MEKRRRKKQKKAIEEVNWQAYFERIKVVCPWSLQAYKQGKIEFVEFDGAFDMDIGNWEARIYHVDRKPRLLKKWSGQLNDRDTECEWLWSHPRYEHYSAEIPIIIQQPRKRLLALRKRLQGVDAK